MSKTITPKAAAAYAKVSPQLIYYWIHKKKVKATQSGTGRFLVDFASLKELIRQRPV